MGSSGKEFNRSYYKKLNEVIENHKNTGGNLIPILQSTQDIFGYIPKEAMVFISQELQIPCTDIYGVATFYSQFHLEPRGKNIIRVCDGTACHVRGGAKVIEEVKNYLGLNDGQTTTIDGVFTLETVSCIGACGISPAMMVNKKVYGNLTPDDITAILDLYREKEGEKECTA